MRLGILVLALLCTPFSSQAQPSVPAPDCASVAQCIAVLREYQIGPPPPPNAYRSSGVNAGIIRGAIEYLVTAGDDGVAALLPLLNHDNYNIQARAGYTLTYFTQIDPRHLPALIGAHNAGVPWLERPIAATGADEALAFLWAAFLADPSYSSNSQVFFALPKFGVRLDVYVSPALQECRSSTNADLCGALLQLLSQDGEEPPDYAVRLLEAIAQSPDASDDVRAQVIDLLVRLRHPLGLRDLIRRLNEAAPVESDATSDDFRAQWLIRNIARYGRDATEAGSRIAEYLMRSDRPNSRAAAAYAIGAIGYREGARLILAQRDALADDWYYAYNAAEAFGRTRAQEARSAVESLSQTHWHAAVRNNAARALNAIDGGAFTRPQVAGDDAPPGDDYWPASGDEVRFVSDIVAQPATCATEATRHQRQFLPDNVRWPRNLRQNAHLRIEEPTNAELREFYAAFPAFGRDAQGPIAFVIEFAGRTIVGTNRGEWGGEVFVLDRQGSPQLLIPDNAIAAFKTNERLFVVTGLSHLSLSRSELWIIERDRGRVMVRRRIRLPQEPTSFDLIHGEALLINGPGGGVVVRSDGTLLAPEAVEGCSGVVSAD